MSDFARYLRAKRTVDDRALDLRVWQRLRSELRGRGAEPRVLDVGAGVGTGLARMIEWGLFEKGARVHYVALEPDAELASAPYPKAKGIETRVLSAPLGAVEPESPELEADFDLVVAHAVLDILEIEPSLERLAALTAPDGLLYCPITFDGETIWEPGLGDDDAVMDAYHGTMKRRGRTGRLLVHALERFGFTILETASSDWIVRGMAGSAAGYPEDEGYFLSFLLETVQGAVEGKLAPDRLERWLRARRRQLEQGELVLIAHQLDVLARRQT